MNSATDSASKPSAAYGQACANCVKAKSKCMPRENGSCERCHRLSKDCQPATFVRKRGARKPIASARKQLEDKLDSLVSLLQAQNAPNSVPATAASGEDHIAQGLASHPARHPQPLPYTEEPNISMPQSGDENSQHQSANRVLSTFRTRYLAFFPFLHLPRETTAEQFQRERPFTWKAIRVVCEAPRALQTEMGAQFIEEVSSLVVAKGERSLDLLLSLVVCTVWQFYFTHSRPCAGMFLSIVRSLIIYLRLDRSIEIALARPKLPQFPDMSEVSRTRTDEERRIMVTCFASFAIISMSLKYDPIRWSPQHEESCQKLSQNLHIFGDQVLVALTRISRVSAEAANMIQRLSEDPEYAAQALLHIKPLRALLDQTRSVLTPEQLQHPLVQSYLHGTYVHIYEGALFHPPSSPLSQPIFDLQRTEYLTACMYATKSSMDNVISTSFVHLNMPLILTFSHAAQVLYKLSVLDYPGWDRALVRATVDVMWYFEQGACKMEQAAAELAQECGEGVDSVYSKAGPAWRGTAAVWREGLESATAALEPEQVGFVREDAPGCEAMDTSWLNIPDDIWFSNFFAR